MKILLILLLLSFRLMAQENRWIDLEWDSIPDAREYEIELFQVSDEEEFSRGTFKTISPKWSHAVSPGKYFIRLRSLDERGVPGEWSEKVDVKVKVLSPVLLRPSENEKLVDSMVSFEWKEVNGATAYQLVIKDASGTVIHNTVTPQAKESIYLKDLGRYQWAVFSLENDDEAHREKELSTQSFKKFERVGGELTAPNLKVQVGEEVRVTWEKIADAETYEVDFIPPPGAGEKNRRYTVTDNSFVFSRELIKDGITTVTVKSLAKGYQDSTRSLVKVLKNENSITAQETVTGKSQSLSKPLSQFFWRHQLFGGLQFSRLRYASENAEADTKLEQDDLSGIGLNVEWLFQDRPDTRQHRLESQLSRFSTSDQSGLQGRLSYHYIFPFPGEAKLWSLGIGSSLLMIPIFLGDRMTDSITSEQSNSLGPEIMLGLVDPMSAQWHFQANLFYSQQLLYLSNPADEASSFAWLKGQIRFLYYSTPGTSYYVGGEYQRWNQELGANSSELNGWALTGGLKKNW